MLAGVTASSIEQYCGRLSADAAVVHVSAKVRAVLCIHLFFLFHCHVTDVNV